VDDAVRARWERLYSRTTNGRGAACSRALDEWESLPVRCGEREGFDVKATVVIATFNRRASVLRCLAAIPPGLEVVVVDDGSADGTLRELRGLQRPSLQVVSQPNRGPASARNLGVRHASGDVLVFTDDDCVPVSPWPQPLIDRLAKDEFGGVGGRVLPLREGMVGAYCTFHRILEPPCSCSYLVTANCAFRRSAFEAAGGFPECIRRAGGEDPGLSFAVRQLGFSLGYEPRAVVRHDYRESIADFARTMFRYGEGCARVLGR
jgi:glycosyltransferase involved in cell wall biosynthesis